MVKNNDKLGLNWKILFWVIPIPAILGLLYKGFFEPHDMHHLADIYEMYRAILSGQIPPRLGPDFSNGFAYPLFNYYYLLPFYLGAFFYWMLGSLTLSFKLVLLLSVLLSYFGMFKFLRLHFDKLAAIAGAALFVYTPYRAVQIYVRGSLGEMLALSLLPWVMYFIGRYLTTRDKKFIPYGALVYFLLVISHNYFFVLFLPIILFYVILVVKDFSKSIGKVWNVILMLILGIGSASYWLVPALLEKSLVRGETPFLLADHFPFIKQLLIPSWGYGSSVWGPTDEISFQIGLINLISIVGLGYFISKIYIEKQKNNLKWMSGFVLIGFLFSFVFMNIRTLPLWNFVPFHNLIQFPWRLLNFTTFFTAIALSVVIQHLSLTKQKLFVSLSLIGMLFVSFFYFHPNKNFHRTDDEYLNLFFKTPGYSEDYLLLPTWVSERPPEPSKKLFESENANIIDQGRIGLLDGWASIQSDKDAEVIVNVYFYPGWKVIVNGKNVKIGSVGEYGKIGFVVPSGNSKVVLKWSETPLRKSADYLSIFFILLIGIIFLKSEKNNYDK